MANAMLLHGPIRGVAALLLADCDAADMQAVRRACRDWITSALAATRHCRHSDGPLAQSETRTRRIERLVEIIAQGHVIHEPKGR